MQISRNPDEHTRIVADMESLAKIRYKLYEKGLNPYSDEANAVFNEMLDKFKEVVSSKDD